MPARAFSRQPEGEGLLEARADCNREQGADSRREIRVASPAGVLRESSPRAAGATARYTYFTAKAARQRSGAIAEGVDRRFRSPHVSDGLCAVVFRRAADVVAELVSCLLTRNDRGDTRRDGLRQRARPPAQHSALRVQSNSKALNIRQRSG